MKEYDALDIKVESKELLVAETDSFKEILCELS
jgi:hypothetical protein